MKFTSDIADLRVDTACLVINNTFFSDGSKQALDISCLIPSLLATACEVLDLPWINFFSDNTCSTAAGCLSIMYELA